MKRYFKSHLDINNNESIINTHPYIDCIIAAILIPTLVIGAVTTFVLFIMYPLSLLLGWI